jgi:hypothetical protein
MATITAIIMIMSMITVIRTAIITTAIITTGIPMDTATATVWVRR